MKIIIGADHRGYNLKYRLSKWFEEAEIKFEDVGAQFYDPNDDYPIFATRVAEKVKQENDSLGIVICGSGVGVCVTANKVEGIRCGQAINPEQVTSSRNHDDIRVLSLSADYMSFESAKKNIEAFINAGFIGEERHLRRLSQIEEIERK